jgi:hypothetical protein
MTKLGYAKALDDTEKSLLNLVWVELVPDCTAGGIDNEIGIL